uniref:DUF4200 domain-containing protein n=1 Tax=Seriola lalandi dorsalis TaxID=1841481 RepID=A0A3B4YMK5_SERLL
MLLLHAQEMRKFLALPIDKKTTHAARMMTKMKKELVGKLDEEEEGEKEKMKNLKQIKSKTTFPKQTLSRHELKMAMMKRETSITQLFCSISIYSFNCQYISDCVQFLFNHLQCSLIQLSLLTKRGEISRMDKAIAKEERQLKQLERMIARDNLIFEEFLRENEKKSVEARTFWKDTVSCHLDLNLVFLLHSELAKFEEILIDYKRYKELLFKLSPPEWQEAQKAKASLKSKVLCDKNTQDKQKRKPKESGISHGKYFSQFSTEAVCFLNLEFLFAVLTVHPSLPLCCVTSLQDQPELYFSDPQQLLDLVTELTEQNLSLIQNSTRVEVTMEGLRQSVETEEQLNIQIDEINQRINKEKAGGNKLKQKVQVHVSLNTEDQDVMLEALGDKVSEVYRSCVDDRMTNLSTLEKLVSIENRMSILLQGLESIPEKVLEMIKRIKDSERRTRYREEKLREQREKQKERMRRYMERSLADSKKIVSHSLKNVIIFLFINLYLIYTIL